MTRAQGTGAKTNITSKRIHDRFIHGRGARLRGLVDVCSDVPEEWREILNVPDEACPECIRGKTHKQGSDAHVPEVTLPGEIISFDIWSFHVPSICGGYKYFFGAICNFSRMGFLVCLKYKSEAPAALGEVLRQCRAAGVTVLRFHTDNENVLHSEAGHQTTVSPECSSAS